MLTVIIAILAVAASLLFVAKKMQKVPKVHHAHPRGPMCIAETGRTTDH